MSGLTATITSFVSRLMSGGTLEIVLLIVLVIVGLVLLLVALWILWKLLVLLGKGILWLFRTGTEWFKTRGAANREARLAAPPAVATGWSSAPRIRLRKALAEASRRADPDAVWMVVVAGEGVADLCRGLGVTPPGLSVIGVAAGRDVVLIDASNADRGALRRLAGALPWRRPVDGIAVLVSPEDVPADAISRAATFARAVGMRTALHFVLPGGSELPAWQIIDSRNRDANQVCANLAEDGARHWLAGGSRTGLKDIAMAQSRGLPGSLARALVAAPSAVLDAASLCLGGAGLRGAVNQTIERTRPATAPGLAMWASVAALVVGLGLGVLAVLEGMGRALSLEAALNTAFDEAEMPWQAQGIDAIPNPARTRRLSGLGARLAETSAFSPLMPLASFVPGTGAPRRLGATFLEAYVLVPLATALDQRVRRTLAPSDDPRVWLDAARQASEWIAAWEGLDDDAREVELRRLFVAAFGDQEGAWMEGTDIALIRTGAKPPPPIYGGLDVDALTTLAQENFVLTMQRWAHTAYTNGPVAVAVRRAIDRSADWRTQHRALLDLRSALQDPSQIWLTAARDRPDHDFELPILGRALGISLLGQVSALEAKAAISAIRIDAREATDYFILPDIGPILVRASDGQQGTGGGPALTLSADADAWLAFLDRIANAGFAELPQEAGPTPPGLVTVDVVAINEARRRLRVFDQFASALPTQIPPSVAQGLVSQLTSELVVGVTAGVENALRPRTVVGAPGRHARQLARVSPAMVDLQQIEAWLRDRRFEEDANRVLDVRARVAAGVLATSEQALMEEDPLGIHLDPAADSNALVRRLERGMGQLKRDFEQLAEPFLDSAVEGGKWAAVNWQNIAAEIAAYNRGETDAVLSGFEGLVRAHAEDASTACEAPRPVTSVGRDDYVARAVSRFRSEFDRMCANRDIDAARLTLRRLLEYYDRYVNWLWPHSRDTQANEIAVGAMDDYVNRLHAAREALAILDSDAARAFLGQAAFWQLNDDGSTAVRFRIAWRTRPNEEAFAENVIAATVEGVETDDQGVHMWRYGTPFAVTLTLAKNSAYRFIQAEDADGYRVRLSASGNGALLRVFSTLAAGAWLLETPLALRAGDLSAEDPEERPVLRLTARVGDADGGPLTLPPFAQHAQTFAAASR